MRNLLVGLAALLTISSFACTNVEDSSSPGLSKRRSRAPSSEPPEPGSTVEHDEGDVEGGPDTGNPNADSAPDAPAAPDKPAAEFAIALAEKTPTVDLGQETELNVTIEPKNGFTGAIDVSVSGLPTGVTATTAQANVGSGPATAKLTLKAALEAPVTPADASVPLVVTAKSGEIVSTANANFKIAPRVKLVIPVNVDALRAAQVQYRDEWGEAFGANQKPLRTQQGNGIVVTVFNADSKSHVIHGTSGFQHGNENAPIQPNAFEMAGGQPKKRTLNVGTNCSGYLHDGDRGEGASFRIRVQAAN